MVKSEREDVYRLATLSVGDVVAYLKGLLGSDDLLGDLWVRGEVSNVSRSPVGHTYFTLKDGEGQLRCVIFRGQGAYGARDLVNGVSALVHGRVSLYEAQGTLQFYGDVVQVEGVGSLYEQFEQLKARLSAEGLFDDERKKPLPLYPRRIGVATSATAAAFQDVQRVLAQRFPSAEVVLSPTLVQGDGAPPQIAAALARLDALEGEHRVDVVLVVRGGGSLEELWAFNSEIVARAMAACTLPIITGVGHEPDVTIADYVADLRMPTPSMAASAAVPDVRECRDSVAARRADLEDEMRAALASARFDLGAATRTLSLLTPAATIRTQRRRVDDLSTELQRSVSRRLVQQRAALDGAAATLSLLNPLTTLQRGYAIVTNPWGEAVSDAAHVTPGEVLRVRVATGNFTVAVLDAPAPHTPDGPP